MKYSEEQKRRIYDKTSGYCHLCGKHLALSNYGKHGAKGAWNVDHSKAQGIGGSDHGNNLFPACISCNSRKGIRSSRSIRRENGLEQMPGQKNDSSGFWIIALFGLILLPPLIERLKERSYYAY